MQLACGSCCSLLLRDERGCGVPGGLPAELLSGPQHEILSAVLSLTILTPQAANDSATPEVVFFQNKSIHSGCRLPAGSGVATGAECCHVAELRLPSPEAAR